MFRSIIAVACVTFVCLPATDTSAQTLGDRLKNVTKRAANEVERSIDRSVRRVTRCALEDKQCIRNAERRGDKVEIVRNGQASGSSSANAKTYRNINFPLGAISFADEVVSFKPGSPGPTEPHRGAHHTLGIPDWEGGSICRTQAGCQYISLGRGGELIVRFTDNVLTGSGNADIDLWIFEVGPDVEDMSVDISTDGVKWQSVGAIGGGKSGVDIDAFGFGPSSAFSYVRLTDDPLKGGQTGATVGADIDAIGAISTRAESGTGCTCP
ncbi:hypothetical protein [Shinella sp.]|uniref:hypothetical protein n=1 Tax=Shinella sp. TaxID=1870904 RepID=UPI003F6E7BEE